MSSATPTDPWKHTKLLLQYRSLMSDGFQMLFIRRHGAWVLGMRETTELKLFTVA